MSIKYKWDQPRKREIVKSYFADKYEKALDSLLAADTAAAVAAAVGGDHQRSSVPKRGVVKGIAGSLFDASVERLKNDKPMLPGDFDTVTESSDDFWKDENFKQETDSEVKVSSTTTLETPEDGLEKRTKEHFLDIFVGKLITRIIPTRLPEREHFGELSEDEKRRSKTVSATKLTSNLKALTPKLAGLFELQDSIVRLLTWRNPSGTLTMLIILTMICYNPMNIIIMPLIYIMFGLMVPGYTRRHPFRRTLYPYRRMYGKSLIKDVTNGGPTAWHPGYGIQEFDYNVQVFDSDDVSRRNEIDNRIEFVVSLRDLQNATTATLSLSKSVERFIYGTAGFVDERHSTVVFFKYIASFCTLSLLSKYINWSFFISLILWLSMIFAHPKVKQRISAHKQKKRSVSSTTDRSETHKEFNIILDESPEVKYVEIFEIYKQGITPRHWDFYKISNQVFDPLDKFRKLQQEPPGVSKLDDILPPRTWVFDENSEWEVDYNVKKWSSERGLSLKIQDEYLIDDSFKRRRLTRKVLRYANPASKPSYKLKK